MLLFDGLFVVAFMPISKTVNGAMAYLHVVRLLTSGSSSSSSLSVEGLCNKSSL